METSRVVQFSGVTFCLVLILSEMGYCYPISYVSSGEQDNIEQGVRDILDDWERQNWVRPELPNDMSSQIKYRNAVRSKGHDIITRKSPRSGGNSNLRLRYGKRSNIPQVDFLRMTVDTIDDPKNSNAGGPTGGINGNARNWKDMFPKY